jgi:hypothetical protein
MRRRADRVAAAARPCAPVELPEDVGCERDLGPRTERRAIDGWLGGNCDNPRMSGVRPVHRTLSGTDLPDRAGRRA